MHEAFCIKLQSLSSLSHESRLSIISKTFGEFLFLLGFFAISNDDQHITTVNIATSWTLMRMPVTRLRSDIFFYKGCSFFNAEHSGEGLGLMYMRYYSKLAIQLQQISLFLKISMIKRFKPFVSYRETT